MILAFLTPCDRRVEGLDRPVLVEIGPGELVELDEIDAERVDFEDVLVHRLGDGQRAVTAVRVEQVVGALGEHLDPGILDLGRLLGGAAQSLGLLDHQGSMTLDLVLDGAGVQPAVDREAEMAALQVVAETAEVVIDGCVGIVVAVDAPVGDDVEPGVLLVERDGADGVLKGLPVHRIRRLLIAGEMTPPRGIPPAGIRIISHHAGGNEHVFASDDHSTSLCTNEGLDAPSVISGG